VPNWKVQIKNYFIFSRKESRGIFILTTLLFLLIIINLLLPYIIVKEETDFTEFEKEIAQIKLRQKNSGETGEQKSPDRNMDYSAKIKPFPFDPNGLPVESWKKLGLDERQIKVIKNYESKGGVFREKEDLASIYSISKEEYKILEPYIKIKENQVDRKDIPGKSNLKPFVFDPNTLPKEQFMEMGLRESVIHAIVNYREKGGKFYNKNDLRKIYILAEEEFIVLEPYIDIKTDSAQFIPTTKIFSISLNDADTIDLQQLPGIGPSFARRIVKYRDLLGGFCTKEQLLEVYGMDSTRYAAIQGYVTVNPDIVRKMNINTISIKEMTRHPYFEFYVAKSILNYRNGIGSYTDIAQIKEAKLVYEQLYNKIEPYLTIK